MKTYISIIESEKVQRMWGRRIVENIYIIKKNVPELIGSIEYNTSAYKWRPSVVMNEIANIWDIPNKYKHLYYEAGVKGFKIINL